VLARATGDRALQPPRGHRVSRQAEVRLGLAAARGEPEQIGDGLRLADTIVVLKLCNAGQVEQDEGHLERVPRAVAGYVDGPFINRLIPALFQRHDRVDALLPHRQVREPERLGRLLVLGQ